MLGFDDVEPDRCVTGRYDIRPSELSKDFECEFTIRGAACFSGRRIQRVGQQCAQFEPDLIAQLARQAPCDVVGVTVDD